MVVGDKRRVRPGRHTSIGCLTATPPSAKVAVFFVLFSFRPSAARPRRARANLSAQIHIPFTPTRECVCMSVCVPLPSIAPPPSRAAQADGPMREGHMGAARDASTSQVLRQHHGHRSASTCTAIVAQWAVLAVGVMEGVFRPEPRVVVEAVAVGGGGGVPAAGRGGAWWINRFAFGGPVRHPLRQRGGEEGC